jgi:hypothetical protein
MEVHVRGVDRRSLARATRRAKQEGRTLSGLVRRWIGAYGKGSGDHPHYCTKGDHAWKHLDGAYGPHCAATYESPCPSC